MKRTHALGLLIIAAVAAGCGQSSPAAPSGATWSAPMPGIVGAASAADAALLQWMASTGVNRGAYFLPPVSQDAAGNDVLAGTTRVFVQQALDGGGQATCTMESDGGHSFFRIGPQGVLDHVNGPATLKYQRFGPAPGFALLEDLTGQGRMNVHLQGELVTLIADGENGETWTILAVDPSARSSAESMSGAGKVGPAGRDLRCGIKSGAARTYIELR